MSDIDDTGDISNFEKPTLHPDEVSYITSLFSESLFADADNLTASLENIGRDNIQDIKEIFEEAGDAETIYNLLIKTDDFKRVVTNWLGDFQSSIEILSEGELDE